MLLEDYFDFLGPDDIRIKGHRIGIETILYEYVHNARTPEEIAARYDTISLEQVYATILYYLSNREQVGAYLTDYLEYCDQAYEEAMRNPCPATLRLRRIKARLETYPPEERDAVLERILAEERAAEAELETAGVPA